MTYKVHLDAYDQSDMILNGGKTKRKDFYYFTETTFQGFRYGDWKFLYKKQEKWFNATREELSTPFIINLKLDPFERFIEGGGRGAAQRPLKNVGVFIKPPVCIPPVFCRISSIVCVFNTKPLPELSTFKHCGFASSFIVLKDCVAVIRC